MIQITTNLPPSGGLLTVVPTTGVAVQDTFHLIAANWVRQFTCCRSVGSLAGGHCILVYQLLTAAVVDNSSGVH